jgi:AhpD family alkylhydroperoxidase
MKILQVTVILLMLAVLRPSWAQESSPDSKGVRFRALAVLDKEARDRINAKPRSALVGETSALLKDVESLEAPESDPAPNYLRAVAVRPEAVKPMAHLVRTLLFAGQLSPETKMGMGFRIAQMHDSPYVAAHLQRWLRASDGGRALLETIGSGNFDALRPTDRLALQYAEWLTQGVHGVSDADFQKVREHFNDAQIVELTTTVCFFNYFTRFSEALNLPVESWVLDSPAKLQDYKYQAPVARVALISDAEMKATWDMDTARKAADAQKSGWGIGFANSMRAMLLFPELAQAWMDYGKTVRADAKIDRNIQLQISFAVSMANGCRYCTLHQVLGLHRLGIDPAKLLSMRKSDESLTPLELTAVVFARKLTRDPASITDADYDKLRKEFGEEGALDVVLQTSTFAFMNRFTDGLHLPSEDEAVRVYREVYASDWKPGRE